MSDNLYPSLQDFKDGYHSDVWRRNTDCLEELKSYSPGKKGGDTNKMASTRYGRINSSVDVTEELRKSGKKLNDQCYEKIIQNLRPGKLFVDSTFAPPNGATWKRPGELEYVNNPKFVDDFSPLDATQGKLDNCWCVVAAITLTLQPQLLLKTVIPTCNRANSFEKSSYRGIFLFRFWNYGEWTEVVIDDRLPVNAEGRLENMTSTNPDEFWCSLLEKAYAKFCGSYDALRHAKAMEALQDFTGGITDFDEIEKNISEEGKRKLFDGLNKNFDENTITVATTRQKRVKPPQSHEKDEGSEQRDSTVYSHAYAVIKIAITKVGDNKHYLILLRNPWGEKFESNFELILGTEYPEYYAYDEESLQELGIMEMPTAGEFWIELDEFCECFKRIQVCKVSPLLQPKAWNTLTFMGKWRNDIPQTEKWQNPAFEFRLGSRGSPGKCTVTIALTQKWNRRRRDEEREHIRFDVYNRPSEFESLPDGYIKNSLYFMESGKFQNLREVVMELDFLPGTYAIVPQRKPQNGSGDFMIRVLSKSKLTPETNFKTLAIQNQLFDQVFSMTEEEMLNEFFKDSNVDEGIINKCALKRILDKSFKPEWNLLEKEATVLEQKKKEKGKSVVNGMLKLVKLKDQKVIPNIGNKYGFHNDTCEAMTEMFGSREGYISFTDFKILIRYLASWTVVYQTYAGLNTNSNVKKEETRWEWCQAFDALNLAREQGVLFYGKASLYKYLMEIYDLQSGPVSFNQFIICASKIRLIYDKFSKTDNPAEFRIKDHIKVSIRRE